MGHCIMECINMRHGSMWHQVITEKKNTSDQTLTRAVWCFSGVQSTSHAYILRFGFIWCFLVIKIRLCILCKISKSTVTIWHFLLLRVSQQETHAPWLRQLRLGFSNDLIRCSLTSSTHFQFNSNSIPLSKAQRIFINIGLAKKFVQVFP